MSSRSTALPPMLREELQAHPDGEELGQLWDALGSAPDREAGGDEERAAAWERVAARTAPRPTLTVVRPSARRQPLWWALAAAAAVALTVATGRPGREEYVAGTQAGHRIVLSDGSAVELNAGSRVRLSSGFRSWFGQPAAERLVTLEGEAFFTVARDGRPFRVRTADAMVEVLGTRFGVRQFAEDGVGTVVIVEEGRVRVAAGSGTLDLSASERARVVSSGAPVRDSVLPPRFLAWRTGGLALVDQPLEGVLHEIARRYGVSLDLAPAVAGTDRLTIYYPTLPTLPVVLADLATSHGLRYERTSRGYRVAPLAAPPARRDSE
jgi:ferric-dicitrate binding protein FerR (iron transport regulator)